ncbi:Eisosomes component [Exophiala dermatitidis]|uniref:Eisosomes component n=1 Tax=Exophiala dermatitidis TaxID=5970 RepID=A0AAN6EQD9_EXODE|nr:Eisosomes component [Exophiala dermatitidis]KAJ4512470.1 Eisosomes component [Exophiala dermatitidis]KAJ4512656.1 Eisosomes component [Exophiala dermatitidis]KAJ4542457.1 Eisosomes component [Exophiala dermatitidis]KAJ4546609.1 Eisosomes component [Exophiala dermatitidis]
MAARGIFSLISLILLAGGLLLMFFILLAGAIQDSPVNKFYILQANTSAIPGAPPVSRWSYWNVCGVQNGRTVCGNESYSDVHPAFPLDPSSHRTFDTTVNVPADFVKHHAYYFYMTRFMFAFMLIALFFGVCALFTGLLALCTRLGSYLSGLLTTLAMGFQAIQVSLMTAAYVKGRNNFHRNGQSARLGRYAFGFEWAAFACFLLSTILFCLAGSARRDTTTSTRRGFFKGRRSRSTRSRGSFVADKEYGV